MSTRCTPDAPTNPEFSDFYLARAAEAERAARVIALGTGVVALISISALILILYFFA